MALSIIDTQDDLMRIPRISSQLYGICFFGMDTILEINNLGGSACVLSEIQLRNSTNSAISRLAMVFHSSFGSASRKTALLLFNPSITSRISYSVNGPSRAASKED